MGYRSDWKIGIQSALKGKLNIFLHDMLDYSTNAGIPKENREIMEFILSQEERHDDTTVVFGDSDTKCYAPWDSVVCFMRDYVSGDEELDMGYIRVGENADDIEQWSEKGYITPQLIRSIDDFDICDIPKHKSAIVAKAQPVKQEEKCSTCGKMKDVGQKCWWCGH